MILPELTDNLNIIQELPDEPPISPSELKELFDKSSNAIKDYINMKLLKAIEDLIEDKTEGTKVIINSTLTSNSITEALSASMGKELNTTKQDKILHGIEEPTGGENGDIYIQVFN